MEDDRKTQIIKAAVKRFARHGLNKTTLNEVARDLRIGKATIYHYFKSKDDLFYQTLEWDSNLFIEDIKSIFNNENLNLSQKLAEYLLYKSKIYNKYKLLYDLLIRHLSEQSNDKEINILNTLFQKEQNELKNIFSAADKENIEILPAAYAVQSWGVLLGTKLFGVENAEQLMLVFNFS